MQKLLLKGRQRAAILGAPATYRAVLADIGVASRHRRRLVRVARKTRVTGVYKSAAGSS
jgi:hypothetical protein